MAVWRQLVIGTVLMAGTACQDAGRTESPPVSPVPDPAGATRTAVQVGAPAPDFVLRDLHGSAVSLKSQRGRVVLLNFWATWCGPCRVEMPAMERLYQEFKDRGFEVLAVSTDAQGRAVTKPFRDSLGLTFPILHDPDFQTGITYGARTLPMTFLVDRDGLIRHRIFGARDWHSPEARRLIEMLLADTRT